MRMYEDPICVLFDEKPRQFIWRERLLLVKKIESRWNRATAWWESDRIKAARGEEVASDGELVSEREVWRVEAGNGVHRGVYELAHTVGAEDWVLQAVLD